MESAVWVVCENLIAAFTMLVGLLSLRDRTNNIDIFVYYTDHAKQVGVLFCIVYPERGREK